MKLLTSLRKQQVGDTIIEVTMALAVLALVLGGATALANRNSRSLRDTQDSTIGLRYSQTQLEYFQSYLEGLNKDPVPASSPIRSADGFCMGYTNPNDTDPGRVPLDATNAQCAIGPDSANPNNQNGSTAAEYKVNIKLTKVTDGTGDDEEIYNAIFSTDWQSLNTNHRNIDINYRIVRNLGNLPGAGSNQCSPGKSKVNGVCVDNPISIKFKVLKIPPITNGENQSQAGCGAAATENIGGVSVNLTNNFNPGQVFPTQQTDASTSSTTFSSNITPNSNYTATATLNDYDVCNTSTVTAAPSDSYPIAAPVIKIQPKCHSQTRYHDVDHSYWTQDVPLWASYSQWDHTGPDWGPSGPYAWNQGYGWAYYPARYPLSTNGSSGTWQENSWMYPNGAWGGYAYQGWNGSGALKAQWFNRYQWDTYWYVYGYGWQYHQDIRSEPYQVIVCSG